MPELRPALRWQPIAAFLLSILGFGDSLYLTIEHYTGNSALVCSATATVDCLKVTTSEWSHVFGAPVALLGLVFFTVMLGVNLPMLWHTSARWLTWLAWARLAMVVGGMGFVIYLLYRELFSIKAICLWCTGVHVVTFLLFVIIVSTAQEMFGGTASLRSAGEAELGGMSRPTGPNGSTRPDGSRSAGKSGAAANSGRRAGSSRRSGSGRPARSASSTR